MRIIVTMPSEASTDYELVRDLVLHGMDCMRINCAHDGPDALAGMIRNLRRADVSIPVSTDWLVHNKGDYAVAEKFLSPHYTQHSAHIHRDVTDCSISSRASRRPSSTSPGRSWRRSEFVIIHGRFSAVAADPPNSNPESLLLKTRTPRQGRAAHGAFSGDGYEIGTCSTISWLEIV